MKTTISHPRPAKSRCAILTAPYGVGRGVPGQCKESLFPRFDKGLTKV